MHGGNDIEGSARKIGIDGNSNGSIGLPDWMYHPETGEFIGCSMNRDGEMARRIQEVERQRRRGIRGWFHRRFGYFTPKEGR